MDTNTRATVRVTPAHGTRARYLHRTLACRCTRCTRANTAYIAAYRARTTGRVWAPRTWQQLTIEGVAS